MGRQPVGGLGQCLLGRAGVDDLFRDALGRDRAADFLHAVGEADDALRGGIALAGLTPLKIVTSPHLPSDFAYSPAALPPTWPEM